VLFYSVERKDITPIIVETAMCPAIEGEYTISSI
jgi:hypothetical protein